MCIANTRAVEELKQSQAQQLRQVIRESPWLIRALDALSNCGGECAYIGAGAIRNLLWDRLHGTVESAIPDDLDVVFFDANVKRGEAEETLLRKLRSKEPELPWDVTNQAYVHHWYAEHLGFSVPPFDSLEDAIKAWPETATAIAARRDTRGEIHLVAPWGLDDLFGLVLRPSTTCKDPEAFEKRLVSKRFVKRWSRLRVVGAGE